MKKLLFILFISSICHGANGPFYKHQDPFTQMEFEKVYENVGSNNDSGSNSNILINGGFEIWQRWTSTASANTGTYAIDRWVITSNETSGVTVATNTPNADSGVYCAKIVVAGSGASKTYYLRQAIENYQEYIGKTVALSVRVKSSVVSSVRVAIEDDTSASYSAYHTGGGAWETLTATRTIAAGTSVIYIKVGMIASGDKGNGTFFFDSAMLVMGSVPVSYVPTNPQTELARCQRYFWRSNNAYVGVGQCTTTTTALIVLRYPVTMRASPTCTVKNISGFALTHGTSADNTTNLVVASLTPYECSITGTLASGLTTNDATILYSDASGYLDFDAEMP